ncbi:hypothetical protein Tco_0471794 [Tanacetum coccineum]
MKPISSVRSKFLSDSLFIPSLEKSPERQTVEEKETPSQLEGEQVDMVTEEAKLEEPKKAKVPKQEPHVIQVDPVQTIIPTTTPDITKVITPITTITPTEATLVIDVSGSSVITPRVDKSKGIATKTGPLPSKPVKALRKVRMDLDALILIEYMIDGKMVHITHDQLQAHLVKKEKMKQAMKEAELSKPKIMKVATEMDEHLQILSRAHNEKLKKKAELRNKTPVTVTVYRINDPRNFEVLKEFKFSDFSISECNKLNVILAKKSNKCVSEMMTSLSKKYERLKEIPNELGLNITLSLPEHDTSLPKRKRKAIELEPKTCIACLHYNRTLPEGVQFVKNLMMASNVKKTYNRRFMVLMSRMIDERPDKERLLTTMLKLENLVDCMMVVKEIENEFLEEVEKLEWWFEQDIDDEEEEDE